MKRIVAMWMAASMFALACAGTARAGEIRMTAVILPPPAKTGGAPLANALAARKSTRVFADIPIAPQQMSNLLWATAGVNREDGRFTYPVARGRQDMALYVFTQNGVFLYNPISHMLVQLFTNPKGELVDPTTIPGPSVMNSPDFVTLGDRRADTGTQPFVASAAVNLVSWVFT